MGGNGGAVTPDFLRQITSICASHRRAKLARGTIWFGYGGGSGHALVLVGFSVILVLWAAWRSRRHG